MADRDKFTLSMDENKDKYICLRENILSAYLQNSTTICS